VASRNTPGGTGQTYEAVYQLSKEELFKVTADDWDAAIRLAISVEDAYAIYDKIDAAVDPDPIDDGDDLPPTQNDDEPNVIVIRPLEPLKCTGCKFETIDPTLLRRHMDAIRHCDVCNESFHGQHSSRNFQRHQKKHLPKPQFPCDKCGKEFKIKSLIKKHKLNGPCGRL